MIDEAIFTVKTVAISHPYLHIHIPINVIRLLNLKANDYIQVTIKVLQRGVTYGKN